MKRELSKDKPTRPGWYWQYGPIHKGLVVVHVGMSGGELWADGCKIGDGWLWAGPIEEPEIPESVTAP